MARCSHAESPGHANALYKVRPEMGAVCYADYLRTMPIHGEMNPCKNITRQTMSALLREYSLLFQDSRLHLGGDEVRLVLCAEGSQKSVMIYIELWLLID